ncbi:MAG: ABC transporter permease [Planctomycetaceae bacterium]|nr:ABC transporter permease [Planctomycetaceae bacterium]
MNSAQNPIFPANPVGLRPTGVVRSPALLLNLPLASLRKHKTRSALTMLGISVGIASVIVIAAVGDGAAHLVEQQVRALGSNLILVLPGASTVGGLSLGAGTRQVLTPDDADAIRRDVPNVKAVSPVVEGEGHLAYGGRNWTPRAIKGEGEDYLRVKEWDIDEGDFLTREDVDAARRVCVLGRTVRDALFPEGGALGARVRIGAMPFQIVGVLAVRGSSASGVDQDDVVIVPWSTVHRTLRGSRFDTLDYLIVSAREERDIPDVMRAVAELLLDRHADPGFRIIPMIEAARLASASADVLTRLLTAVASLSLAVGGVGIANILLVSVRERTREIGVRLAVGARSRDILAQFLSEGLLTALVGGGAGIVLGIGLAVAIGQAFGWPIRVAPEAAATAALVSAAVGLVSGAYPSYRASRLDPVAALRGD